MTHRISQELSHGWRLTRHSPDDKEARWIPVKTVPTVVHLDLMALPDGHPDKISDPFLDLNEFDARWVADARWTYECRFKSPKHITALALAKASFTAKAAASTADHGGSAQNIEWKNSDHTRRTADLVFRGLDTLSTVTLNGSQILKTDNMFTKYTVDVTNELHVDPVTENVLRICFDSARATGLTQVQYGPSHEYHVHQTEVGRAAVRKAQYQWGWDWGPVLVTSGPWQPVILDSYDVCISKVRIWTFLSEDLKEGRVTLSVGFRGHVPLDVIARRLKAHFVSPSGQDLGGVAIPTISASQLPGTEHINLDFNVPSPDLWWPAGYGRQDMYTVKITVSPSFGGPAEDLAVKTFAFRRSRLIQEPDKHGKSFFFRINNVDIFAGGSCWIPADSFLRTTNYRQWMEMLVNSHQTMVRVWGGGIYESDAFYDACDELGLLVWQDFAFACASYPAGNERFLESVKIEARQNVERLQRHPSLVVWAGNNEDYQIKEHYDLQYDPTATEPDSWRKTKFPARYMYEHVLPGIVHDSYGAHVGAEAVPYQPGSPYGDPRSTTLKADPSIGDIHQWDVWHGAMRHYQEYQHLGGRFVSEFGMQAYPHLAILQDSISAGGQAGRQHDQLWPGSLSMDVRNKAIGHQFRMLKYVAENFRVHELDNLATFGHLTQVMQADAVSHAYRGWRRLWTERQCGGALIWQLNDCWPTVSWSIVDYGGTPKPAYYAVRRALAPLAISVQRAFHNWTTRNADDLWQRDTGHVEPSLSSALQYSVWAASSRLEAVADCRTEVRFVSIATGRDVVPRVNIQHDIQPNAATPVLSQSVEVAAEDGSDSAAAGGTQGTRRLRSRCPCVVSASLYVGGKLVSSDTSWPDPIKYLEFPDRKVAVDVSQLAAHAHSAVVVVTAERPVKGFVFAEDVSRLQFSDNGFDVLPGERHSVTVTRKTAHGPWPALPYAYVGQDIWG